MAAAAVPVALVLAAVSADGPGGSETTVAAPDGVSATVPATWARQVRTGGWTPGADGVRRPALEAAPDLGRLHDLAGDGPGLFIGRVDAPDARSWSGEHAGCGAAAESRVGSPHWSGVVRRWDRCPGRGVDESVLTDAADRSVVLVVQVRGGGGQAVRRLLDGVRAR